MVNKSIIAKSCRECSTELTHANTTPSRVKRYDWICSACHKARLLEYDEHINSDRVKKKAKRLRRRAAERGAPPMALSRDFEPIAKESLELVKIQGYQVDVDHIIPISAGGCNCPSNLQVLSIEEHRHKTTKVDPVWLWLHEQTYPSQGEVKE